jgi:hypothetical protein
MEQPDLVYSEHDLHRISSAALNLGVEEGGVVAMVENESNYAGDKLRSSPKVPGSLSKGSGPAKFYREVLDAPSWVCEIVEDGYTFPLTSYPPPTVKLKNNKSAERDPDFTWHELCRLETLDCIERVCEQPRVVLPLTAVFSKKMRLVVDASQDLNPYLEKRDVALEDLTTLAEIVEKEDWIAIDDLDSGYWHVALNPIMRELVGVHFPDPETGEPVFWRWKVLFLGINDAVF